MERTLREMLDEAGAASEGSFDLQIGSNWSQGRTTYGGLGAALGVTSLRSLVPADRPLRSVLVSFAAPIPVGATVRVDREILRQGGSATSAQVRMIADGTPATVLVATYGAPREAGGVEPEKAKDMPNESDLALSPTVPGMPGFLDSFDVKWVGNGIPTANSKDTRLQVFARLRDADGVDAAAQFLALADMPPPIMMSHYPVPTAGATMSWSLDFVKPPRDWMGGWIYFDYALLSAQNGYCQQAGKLYDETGGLLAVSHQTMVYFEPKS